MPSQTQTRHASALQGDLQDLIPEKDKQLPGTQFATPILQNLRAHRGPIPVLAVGTTQLIAQPTEDTYESPPRTDSLLIATQLEMNPPRSRCQNPRKSDSYLNPLTHPSRYRRKRHQLNGRAMECFNSVSLGPTTHCGGIENRTCTYSPCLQRHALETAMD